jgi:Flp pilus assembly protein TadG
MKNHRNNAKNKGTAILESVFAMIIMLTFTLALIGISWAFYRAQQITNAARHGVRIGVRWEADNGDVTAAVDEALGNRGLTYTIPLIQDVETAGTGEPVIVSVEGTGLDILNLNTLTILGMPIPDSFKASVTMAKEGP